MGPFDRAVIRWVTVLLAGVAGAVCGFVIVAGGLFAAVTWIMCVFFGGFVALFAGYIAAAFAAHWVSTRMAPIAAD